MNDNATDIVFENREELRAWLEKNHNTSDGIWIVLTKGNKDFSSNDALEEAICFGWIDGIIKSIDNTKYKKYFSKRKDRANWSEKNKSIYKILNEKGLITKHGVEAFGVVSEKIDNSDKNSINTKNIIRLKDALEGENDIIKLFEDISTSRQKQLAGFYCEAKTVETQEKRKYKIIEALKNGYKGMLY